MKLRHPLNLKPLFGLDAIGPRSSVAFVIEILVTVALLLGVLYLL